MVAILEQLSEAHPKEPHWHLPFVGADPAHQGKGIGAALLRYGLDRIDREGSVTAWPVPFRRSPWRAMRRIPLTGGRGPE
jgi:ribosomal protein S18 acetylase RimI-like enzyme